MFSVADWHFYLQTRVSYADFIMKKQRIVPSVKWQQARLHSLLFFFCHPNPPFFTSLFVNSYSTRYTNIALINKFFKLEKIRESGPRAG